MSQKVFQELAKKFESLHAELQQVHGAVLHGIIQLQMRNTLDAMWAENAKYREPAMAADLEEKEQLMKIA